MSTKYRITDLPTSPIRGDDKLIVNRKNVSHKIDASDLVYFLAQIELPIDISCTDINVCPDGYACVDGKCERIACGDNDLCPLGYVCINDNCFKECDDIDDCKDGHICVDLLGDGNTVCVPYPFPCDSENGCPEGFDCYEGFCLQNCHISPNWCPPGSDCFEFEVYNEELGGTFTDHYCVPTPFPCGSIGEYPNNQGCPPGYYCYGGMCHKICTDDSGCSPNEYPYEHCVNIGNEDNNQGDNTGSQISICLPIDPTPGLVNDGKLNIIDDANNRRIIFSANQYGDTFLQFKGIDIDGGNGGGSGSGDLIFKTLWERINLNQLDSDIQPTYQDVDILPHGTDSNVGSNTARWDGVFTEDLNITRDVYGNLIPHTDDTYDVGESSRRWSGLFTKDLNITRDVYGNLIPHTDDTYDVGEPNRRWRNIYTNDLNLSNKSKANDVDGTWGDYTIQEGEDNLYLINNRNGKKYKFMLEEVN